MKTHSHAKCPINQSSQVTEYIILCSRIEVCITGRGAAYLDLKIYFAPVYFYFLSGGVSVCTVWFCIVHYFYFM